MSLPPLATPEELALYTQNTVDGASATFALTMASGKVRDYINRPDLALLTDATTAPDGLRAVVLSVAARLVNNPGDLRQEAVGSVSVTYASETLGVQLAEWERRDLRKYKRGAWSVTTREEALECLPFTPIP